MVEWALKNSIGGEIFVPKIPSYKILDLAKAICPNCKIKIIGIRSGEKLHEELVSIGESQNTLETNNYFIILPTQEDSFLNSFKKKFKAKKVKKEFSYRSNNNKFLSVAELKNLIKK